MTKYLKKFKDLPKTLQKLLSTKLTNGDVEVVEMENEKTIIQAIVNTSYNRNMRSKSFEKSMLDFVKRQEEYNARNDEFQKFVLDFIKEQKEFNKRQEDINKRNNLK